ncbi:hypothetical protein [Methylobacterium sp. WL9]|uniref:hypothetical protein n=1 Tax=Methylobacterium sp. WL9 TaxID=2603898 RepID=UPI0011C86049|nr:hypothetical protein [Methylobacterium sp. WL9]TXN24979.1 hypothetical protein FV217_00030 [Methylobacterium sp. WL9]
MSREKLKAERIGFVKEIELATKDNLRDFCLYERDEYTLESIGNNVSLVRGTIIRNIKQKNPDRSLYLSDEGPFIAYLRNRAKIKLENKEENEAISPACFRHVEGKDTVTAGVNVSNNHYRNIVCQIIHKIEATGSYVRTRDPSRPYMKAHGIDPKYDASNKFYLPCKPGNGGAGIFRVFDDDGRSPLDVDNWLENSVVPLDDEIPVIPSITADSDDRDELTPLQSYIAEKALDKFRSAPKESGHVMFYNLNRRLLHNGIRGHHWRLIMSQAVGCARSKAERQKEMEEYMKDAA